MFSIVKVVNEGLITFEQAINILHVFSHISEKRNAMQRTVAYSNQSDFSGQFRTVWSKKMIGCCGI